MSVLSFHDSCNLMFLLCTYQIKVTYFLLKLQTIVIQNTDLEIFIKTKNSWCIECSCVPALQFPMFSNWVLQLYFFLEYNSQVSHCNHFKNPVTMTVICFPQQLRQTSNDSILRTSMSQPNFNWFSAWVY